MQKNKIITFLLLSICIMSINTICQGCLFTGKSPGKSALVAYTMTAEGMNGLKKEVMSRCQSGRMKPDKCQEMKDTFNQAVFVFQQAEPLAELINHASAKQDVSDSRKQYDAIIAELDILLSIISSFLQN